MAKNTINQTQLKNNDGWQLCPETATYVDVNAIKFTGTTIDNTISKGMKLKLTNDGTVKYYTITSFATLSTDRAFILSGPVSLVSGAITNIYFSTEDHPYGFPYDIPQQAWQEPTLGNSWVNFGGVYETAGYMKDSMGFVHIKGLVKSGTIGSAIFTLPTGYRPSAQIYLLTLSNGAVGVLEINSSGVVLPSAGSNTSFSISNVSFKAA